MSLGFEVGIFCREMPSLLLVINSHNYHAIHRLASKRKIDFPGFLLIYLRIVQYHAKMVWQTHSICVKCRIVILREDIGFNSPKKTFERLAALVSCDEEAYGGQNRGRTCQ